MKFDERELTFWETFSYPSPSLLMDDDDGNKKGRKAVGLN